MDRQTNSKFGKLLVLLPVLYFFAILFKTSWICDDAYITFRTVDNFIHGLGLRWNVIDRVQTYTNPLWMFAVSGAYAITREIYYTVTVLMFAASLGAILILIQSIATSHLSAAVGVLILATSKAFTDYSTSGLENPLTHLILAAFIAAYFAPGRRRLLTLSLLLALAMVNRLDTVLLLAPAVVAAAWNRPRPGRIRDDSRRLDPLLGLGDLLGSLLRVSVPELGLCKARGRNRFRRPSRAGLRVPLERDPVGPADAARLARRVGPRVRAQRTRRRAGHDAAGHAPDPSSARTPVAPLSPPNSLSSPSSPTPPSLPTSLTSMTSPTPMTAATPPAGERSPSEAPIGIGIALYLLYTIRIGGDFMSGRFLAAPLFCAVALLSRRNLLAGRSRAIRLTPIALVVALGFLSIDPPLLSGPKCGVGRTDLVDARGISDERAYYYQGCGLLRAFEGCRLPCHFLRTRGNETREEGPLIRTAVSIGLVGFYAGPEPYLIDFYGLADPFVARLPLKDPSDWRIGHFTRDVSPEYLESIRTGENKLRDPRQRRLWDDLLLVTQAPILLPQRIAAVVRLNLTGI